MIKGRGRGILVSAFIVAMAAMGAMFSDVSASMPKSSGPGDDADSLVRLMSAQSAQLLEMDGHKFRKVIGPARFLHNGTYLICDTALWNVDQQVINAVGNVQLLQEETVLSSDRLDYFVERDVAEFRGVLVQLVDKDQNTLRTRYLDYNTKDSLAIFSRGASMKDGTGQIIESLDGTYDSKSKIFTFEGDVNMFTDSVFVRSDELVYMADPQVAYFYKGLDAWQDDKMLSADEGIYDRAGEQFSFFGAVHLLSDDQEGWADTLLVYRSTGDMSMRHEAQLHDRSRHVTGVGDMVDYSDSLSMMTVRERAAIVGEIDENDRIDTVYFGGDTLRYWTEYSSLIPEDVRKDAGQRLSDLSVDPVAEYRSKAAKAAAEAAAEAQAQADAALGKKTDAGLSSPSDTTDTASSGLKKLEAGPKRQPVTLHSLIGKLRDFFSSLKEARLEKRAAAASSDTLAAPADSAGAASSLTDAADSAASGTIALADSLDADSTPADAADSVSRDSLGLEQSLQDDMASAGDTLSGTAPFPVPDDVPADSSATDASDSISTAPFDSTRITFMSAVGNVKVFRQSMQVICDSLLYSDLDSLTRLFKDPVVWNEGNHQYRSDSLTLVLEGGHMRKASLMSNAFVIIQEDTDVFDQIKGVEMMAWFDTSGTMTRYDVMGGASALFYLQENDAWATANKAESKLLSVDFKDGDIDRVYYYDTPHNDAYPVVQLPSDMSRMKGFSWQPELRPRGPWDITSIALKKSERTEFMSRPKAKFTQSDRFFPGYMQSVYDHIAYRDSMKVVNKARRDSLAAARKLFIADSLATARADSLFRADSLALADSLFRADSLALADSLSEASRKAVADSVAAVADSIARADSIALGAARADSLARMDSLALHDPQQYARELRSSSAAARKEAARKAAAEARKQKASEREAARKARVEKREARWAELDARDAARIAAKQEKILQKKRRRTARELDRLERQASRDQARLDRYVERYRSRAPQQPAAVTDTLNRFQDEAVFEPDEESIPVPTQAP